MTMYQNTKFGYKRFSSSEDSQMNINWNYEIMNIHYGLDLECNKPLHSLDIFVYDDLPSN